MFLAKKRCGGSSFLARSNGSKNVNLRKTTVHRGLVVRMSVNHKIAGRKIGLLNLGKVMSCHGNVTMMTAASGNDGKRSALLSGHQRLPTTHDGKDLQKTGNGPLSIFCNLIQPVRS